MAAVIEVNPDALRDLAGAIHAASLKDPASNVFSRLERQVLDAIQGKERHLVLTDTDATAVEEALRRRAYDQRATPESLDYEQLANRIASALGDTFEVNEGPAFDEIDGPIFEEVSPNLDEASKESK